MRIFFGEYIQNIKEKESTSSERSNLIKSNLLTIEIFLIEPFLIEFAKYRNLEH